jgi:ubiquinone/menaquinone biosynthesis C-methylase UbiE
MNFTFRLPEFDAVKAALAQTRGGRLLDVGCGDGMVTRLMPSHTIAVDASAASLEQARTRTGARLLQCEPDSLPFPDCYFDTVVCTKVIDHLACPERRAGTLREIRRVLKPKGKVILTVLHQNFRFDGFQIPKEGFEGKTFYHRFYLDEFRGLLAEELEVDEIWGLWTYLPKTYPIYTRLGPAVIYWERVLRQRVLSLKYCKFFLAICRPRAGSFGRKTGTINIRDLVVTGRK